MFVIIVSEKLKIFSKISVFSCFDYTTLYTIKYEKSKPRNLIEE